MVIGKYGYGLRQGIEDDVRHSVASLLADMMICAGEISDLVACARTPVLDRIDCEVKDMYSRINLLMRSICE